MSVRDDPHYRAAVSDLLGVLAYGELTACIRMAVDADAAPGLHVKAGMAGLAAAEYRQYEQIVTRLRELDLDPEVAMAPFVGSFTAYHDRTRPRSWLEGLVKAYVGEGIAKDFYREISGVVDEDTRAVVESALDDDAQAEFVVGVVRQATKADPTSAGRLALWGRRLVGEALSQGQAVAVDRDALTWLLMGPGSDLGQIGEMFTRLTRNHQKRMNRLGLDA